MSIYAQVIQTLVEKRLLSIEDHILAVCAGPLDRNTFEAAHFKNVLITNLDHHGGVTEYSPFQWELQDAEYIRRDDDSFDWSVVHAGLHHCASPHRALCEMLRVARKGVIVFESRDSLFLRMAIAFGLTVEYELEPIALSNGTSGGLRNSPIPNYVYRWTEREIEKTVASFLPQYEHEFHYFYGYRVPLQRLSMSPSAMRRYAARLLKLAVPVLEALLPKQGNEFAFVATKKGKLQPWLEENSDEEIRPNLGYFQQRFRTDKYQR
jgi:ubiquinone/menaquinone biosynthesis C-methylase UbiE